MIAANISDSCILSRINMVFLLAEATPSLMPDFLKSAIKALIPGRIVEGSRCEIPSRYRHTLHLPHRLIHYRCRADEVVNPRQSVDRWNFACQFLQAFTSYCYIFFKQLDLIENLRGYSLFAGLRLENFPQFFLSGAKLWMCY